MEPQAVNKPQQKSDGPAAAAQQRLRADIDLKMMDFQIRIHGTHAFEPTAAEMLPARKTALIEELKSQLVSAEPVAEAERWEWLVRYSGLRVLDSSQTEAFGKKAEQQVNALLQESSQAEAETDVSKIDQSMRVARACSDFGPPSSQAACLSRISALHQHLRSADMEHVTEYIDQTIAKGEAAYRTNLKQWQTELLNALNNPDKQPMSVGFWAQLASRLDLSQESASYIDGAGGSWTLETFGPTLGADTTLSLRSTADRGCFVTLRGQALLELMTSKELDPRLLQARADREQETDTDLRRPLRELDLEANRTCCLTISPKRHDRVTTTALFGMLTLESVLATRYGADESSKLILSDQPEADLRTAVGELARRPTPPKDVVINIDEHGDLSGFRFTEPLSAAQLRALAGDFPQIRFHMVTNACHGAGLRDGILSAIDPAPPNLAAYLPVKPDVINLGMFTAPPAMKPTEPNCHAPYQTFLLLRQLIDPNTKTFGEAFDNADREAKKVVPADGEAILNGELFSGLRFPTRVGSFVA